MRLLKISAADTLFFIPNHSQKGGIILTTLRSLLRLKNGSDRLSITEQLKRDNLPVVMWGAGNVAHSVKAILDRSSIPLAGIWVDSPPPQYE